MAIADCFSFIVQFSLLDNLHMTSSTIFHSFCMPSAVLYWQCADEYFVLSAIKQINDFHYTFAHPKRYLGIVTILILAVSLYYWFAFFPAAMTPDSLAQWRQAHNGEFNDWHPIMITWLIMR